MGSSRPPRPNNVVALSHYRARLGRGRRLRRADALLEAPDLAAAVRALPGDELYYVLHEMGLGEGGEILAAATAEQLSVVLDFALWERDQFEPGGARRVARGAGVGAGRTDRPLAGRARHRAGGPHPPPRGADRRSRRRRQRPRSRRGSSTRRPTASSCSTSGSRPSCRRTRLGRSTTAAAIRPARSSGSSTRSTGPTRTSRGASWSAPRASSTPSWRRPPTAGGRGAWPISASPTTTRRWRSTGSSTRPA